MTETLDRFVTAQHTEIGSAMAELRQGRKTSHWMWFVFPQLRGLGRSSMAHHYGVIDLAEAQAYLAHPILGPRLLDCTALVDAWPDRTVHDIFGSPDDLKFHSSMTLFAHAGAAPCAETIRTRFAGAQDQATLQRLA